MNLRTMLGWTVAVACAGTAMSVVRADEPVAASRAVAADAPVRAAESVDELVFGRLKELGIRPAETCSDEVFVRRVYLDVIGTLPTSKEVRGFLEDKAPDKRRVLIDRLLQRDEFADYWSLKWCDLLRVKAEFPVKLWPNAVQAYHRWVRQSIKNNKPYDRFVREMLTASGSNFRVGQVNFYRGVQNKQPPGIVRAVALTFMGARAETWPKETRDGMGVFFSQVGYKPTREWKEEIVFWDRSKGRGAGLATFPDGRKVRLTGDRDPREVFADWLVDPKNPQFTKAISNRVWYWLLGRGIVHEPDDIRPDNPASHPKLLALLQRELVAARYDIKHLFRLILNSRTYQMSSVPRTKHPAAAANFAYYPLRRLDAEVLIDALCSISGTTEKYSSMIPEPFTFIPEDTRSIALADGSITSSFLVTFGRPPRDTGTESERNNRITAAQRLHLLNSSHVQRKVAMSLMTMRLMRFRRNPKGALDEVYLTILSRYPTADERKTIRDYQRQTSLNGRDLLMDIVWALINSDEFLYRH